MGEISDVVEAKRHDTEDSVGRQGIADYYGAQPLGLTAAYKILETRRPPVARRWRQPAPG